MCLRSYSEEEMITIPFLPDNWDGVSEETYETVRVPGDFMIRYIIHIPRKDNFGEFKIKRNDTEIFKHTQGYLGYDGYNLESENFSETYYNFEIEPNVRIYFKGLTITYWKPSRPTPLPTIAPTEPPTQCLDVNKHWYLKVNSTEFMNFNSLEDGGIMEIINGGLLIERSTFINCSSSKRGGAIFFNCSIYHPLTIRFTKFNNCTSNDGGAVCILN